MLLPLKRRPIEYLIELDPIVSFFVFEDLTTNKS